MEPIPPSPEQWREIVENACHETGWGDEIITAVEVTMNGWRVTVNPVQHPNGPPLPQEAS